MAERARDRKDRTAATGAVQRLDMLVSLRNSLPGEAFAVRAADDVVEPAHAANFHAESARCRGQSRTSAPCEEAAQACSVGGFRWDEAVSLWRQSQALMNEGAKRPDAVGPLRSAHVIALDIGADPLRLEVEALAQISRISLQRPVIPAQGNGERSAIDGLTRREVEVLTHLVAGRSYVEIGDELFISHKTVSVHVSNLLRKTGTSNRREAAALAHRNGLT